MKRFFTYLMALVLASAALLSCVKDEERIFEDSASARITKYLGEAQKLLVDAPNGWVMYYYPNGPGKERNSQEIGGFVYTLVFTDKEVTAWTEIFEGGSTSLYSMSTDDGPILNFDTFNYNLYYFATPAGSAENIYGLKGGTYYKAHQGDIGFKILSYSADKIVLRGKRSGNYYMMYPLPASTSPEEYAAESARMAEDFGVSTFEGKFAGKDAQFFVNLNNRQIEMNLGSGAGEDFQAEETQKTAFAYIPDGIKFYKPAVTPSRASCRTTGERMTVSRANTRCITMRRPLTTTTRKSVRSTLPFPRTSATRATGFRVWSTTTMWSERTIFPREP